MRLQNYDGKAEYDLLAHHKNNDGNGEFSTMTNKLIRSRMLRSLYAHELWQARILRKSYSGNEWKTLRFGIETGFWAVQKAILLDTIR